MIALEDCIALCVLAEEEVLAIAEHEHLPEIGAEPATRDVVIGRERLEGGPAQMEETFAR